MQLPAPAVPRLIRKEEQIHGIAAGVQVRRPLIPTELAQVLPIGVDLMGEEGGLFLQLGHFFRQGCLGFSLGTWEMVVVESCFVYVFSRRLLPDSWAPTQPL